MARYSRRGRRSYSRSTRRTSRRSYSSRGGSRRYSRRSSGGARTIRIVVEQPAATQQQLLASRGLAPQAGPRRRAF